MWIDMSKYLLWIKIIKRQPTFLYVWQQYASKRFLKLYLDELTGLA